MGQVCPRNPNLMKHWPLTMVIIMAMAVAIIGQTVIIQVMIRSIDKEMREIY